MNYTIVPIKRIDPTGRINAVTAFDAADAYYAANPDAGDVAVYGSKASFIARLIGGVVVIGVRK